MKSGVKQKKTVTDVVGEKNNNSGVEVGDLLTKVDNYDRVRVPPEDMEDICRNGNYSLVLEKSL